MFWMQRITRTDARTARAEAAFSFAALSGELAPRAVCSRQPPRPQTGKQANQKADKQAVSSGTAAYFSEEAPSADSEEASEEPEDSELSPEEEPDAPPDEAADDASEDAEEEEDEAEEAGSSKV